jgi:hypothetical protein
MYLLKLSVKRIFGDLKIVCEIRKKKYLVDLILLWVEDKKMGICL